MRRLLLALLVSVIGTANAGAPMWVYGHYYHGNWISGHYRDGGWVSGHWDHFSPAPGVRVGYWVGPGQMPHYGTSSWWYHGGPRYY